MEQAARVRAVVHIDHRGSLTEAVDLDAPFRDEPIVDSYDFRLRDG